MTTEGKTHWETCWREHGHHACAIAKIEAMETPCVWTFHPEHRMWTSGCRPNFHHHMRGDYCLSCGHPVEIREETKEVE